MDQRFAVLNQVGWDRAIPLLYTWNYTQGTARDALPGTSQQLFNRGTGSGITERGQNVLTAFSVQPYTVNEDSNEITLEDNRYYVKDRSTSIESQSIDMSSRNK
jgi:hypothetical protein